VAEPLPQWASFAADPGVVFAGGPVDVQQAVAIGEAIEASATRGFEPVAGTLGTVDLSLDPAALETGLRWVRIFVGYAGWGPGQLEAERRAGAWFDVELAMGDVPSMAPDELWGSTLARQGPPLAWFARFPDEPSTN
jgi:putative transcriptional regulator